VHEEKEDISFDESFMKEEEDFYLSNDDVVKERSRIRWDGNGY
jgi:hypothetical protein